MIRVLLVQLALLLPGVQGGSQVPTILRALDLPSLATAAREAGVAEGQVRETLARLHARGMPAGEAALVLQEEVAAIAAGGPTDRFGMFVQAQVEAGLRGRALAEAVRDEHIVRREGRGPQP